jgi:hypothetical protein
VGLIAPEPADVIVAALSTIGNDGDKLLPLSGNDVEEHPAAIAVSVVTIEFY